MFRWLYRLLSKRYGPQPSFGPLAPEEWEGLLAELADGYEKHEAVFRAIHMYMRKTEQMALKGPTLKTPADLDLWGLEQYGLVREVAALRFLLRLPNEGQKLKAKLEKKETPSATPAPVPDLD